MAAGGLEQGLNTAVNAAGKPRVRMGGAKWTGLELNHVMSDMSRID